MEDRLQAVYDRDRLLMAAYDGERNRVFQLNYNLHTDEDAELLGIQKVDDYLALNRVEYGDILALHRTEQIKKNNFFRYGNVNGIKSSDLIFGSSTKSTQKIMNQMNSRGWTDSLIRNTVDDPYIVRDSVNKATGNSATVFYTQQGSYVIVDDVTKAIVQISDNVNPSTWAPDLSIINPYIPN